jgi:large subunit ribosomal protein L5
MAQVKLAEKPRMKEKFNNEIVPEMMKRFNYKSTMQVPRIEKIVINMGIGETAKDSKILEAAMSDLATLSGQKPVVRKAKKSVAGFKIREGQPVGIKVTLRGNMMYEFLDRFLSTAIPRMRDFRGLTRKSFDKFGNYSMGIDEQLIFPEIDYDKIDQVRGMDITFTTTSKTKDESESLLELIGFPFKEKQ